MNDGLSSFLEMLAARVPSWDIDYGSCRDLLTSAFPAGQADQQQVSGAIDDFMRSIEAAIIDEVGFDDYCRRFASRTDKGGFSVLPDQLQSQYEAGTPYEKLQLFWHDDAPRRYLFHILTTLFGEVFGRAGADSVFRPLWRSFIHSLRSEGRSSSSVMASGQVAVAGSSMPGLPSRWNEVTVAGDLRRLSASPSAVGHYIENLRERFIIRQDVKTLNRRAEWLEAKLRELKIAVDIQGTVFNLTSQRKEHELRTKQLALQHLQADTDLANAVELAPLRNENSRLTLQAEAARLRKEIRDLSPEPAKKQDDISPQQKRANDKAVSEARLNELKQLKQDALTIENKEERMQKVNAIDHAMQGEMERWAKLL